MLPPAMDSIISDVLLILFLREKVLIEAFVFVFLSAPKWGGVFVIKST